MSKIIRRVLFLLMPNDFQDTEFLEPYEMINADDHHVDVAGLTSRNIAKGTFGLEFEPNLILSEMTPQDFDLYDALVIPGGQGCAQYLWDNEEVQNIARYFHENDKVIAAICHACVVFAQAELLRNKHATVFPSPEALAIFKTHEVEYKNEACISLPDEKIITCQGPKYARIFGQAILNLL
ncbi:MAG: DJ-1/PfpI family protein [bacterium]